MLLAPATGPLTGATSPHRSLSDELSRFPKAWQRVLTPDAEGKPSYGVVTFSCSSYCEVLIGDSLCETTFTNRQKLHWSEADETGMLPLQFFVAGPAPRIKGERLNLLPRNYDLLLTNGTRVGSCFFKEDRFLEVGGAHRYIALADVSHVRPSAA